MKIGFIGTGNMGGAILRGFAASEASEGCRLLIHNRTSERSSRIAREIPGVEILPDNTRLAEESDMIIIGVKPNGVGEVLR